MIKKYVNDERSRPGRIANEYTKIRDLAKDKALQQNLNEQQWEALVKINDSIKEMKSCMFTQFITL